MSLMTLRDVLEQAEKTKSAVAGFNIDNLEMPRAIVEAAEKLDMPVILTIGQGAIQTGGLVFLSDAVKRLAAETWIPVVLHLDHGNSYEQVIQCIRAGFSSVMIDGSHLSLADNIVLTREVIKAAKSVDVSVEAELGAIGGIEDGISHKKRNLVDVEEVKQFLSEVEVDALAVGIGNAHGLYRGEPELNFELLKQVKALNPPHLVLHGGSGIPDEMIQKAIEIGIRKINIATELRLAFIKGIEKSASTLDIYKMYEATRENVMRLATRKMKLFNCR